MHLDRKAGACQVLSYCYQPPDMIENIVKRDHYDAFKSKTIWHVFYPIVGMSTCI